MVLLCHNELILWVYLIKNTSGFYMKLRNLQMTKIRFAGETRIFVDRQRSLDVNLWNKHEILNQQHFFLWVLYYLFSSFV